MRSRIVILDKLIQHTLRVTALKTTLLGFRKQAGIRRFHGNLDWQGNPE
jgi:hypothetical protein